MKYNLHHGNNIEVLRQYPDNYFHSCPTDPPYGLRFMGRKWDYQVPSIAEWEAIYRVLRPGAFVIAFGGTRTYHRLVCNIEDAGFEIRDMMAWIYGSGFPKSHNITDELGTALKPAIEPIVLARKPLDGTVQENYDRWKTGVLNIEACRIPGEPWTFGSQTKLNGGNYGTNRPSDGHVHATNVTGGERGRWPANIQHDGSDEVLAVFPNSKGQQGDVKGTEPRNTGDENTVAYGKFNRVGFRKRREDDGSTARFFYCSKASRADRNEGCESMDKKSMLWSSGTKNLGSFQSENTDRSSQNNWPTVKPTNLMRYYVRLITPPKGIVLDPFMGSGSTGKACAYEFAEEFVGIDRESDALPIAKARIEYALRNRDGQINIFETKQ